MKKWLQKKFALSEKGTKDLVKAIIACTLTDIGLMLPVGFICFALLVFLHRLEHAAYEPPAVYGFILLAAIILAVIWILERIQYNATFLAAYEESANQRIHIAEKLRKTPLSFFGKKDLSDLTTTVMSDCAGMETAFSHFIPELFGAVFSVILVGIVLLIYDWRLGIALLWVVPVAFIITYAGKKSQDKVNGNHETSVLERANSIQECIENVKEIKAGNQTERYLAGVSEVLRKSEKMNIRAELGTAVFVVSSQMMLRIGVVTMVLCGSFLLLGNKVSFFQFLIFLIAASRLFEPLAIALQNMAAIFATQLKVNRMKEIENQKIQTGKPKAEYSDYDIHFRNVSFSYNENGTASEKPVLKDVSFTAKQGEVTALVGPSGSGKSTISKLAARFWDVDQGSILLGKTDVATVEPEELFKSFSIVFQDVLLFNNTVLENIRIGKKDASDEEVMEAAKLAVCDDFIQKMPKGYQTVIGENGSALSGGERQRISIARAILKDAPIILLDEATASLDAENESKVQKALTRLIQSKTVLVIAHRMRTIAGADHIVLLSEGKVAEEGTHDTLMDKKGIYYHLWNLQMKAANWRI